MFFRVKKSGERSYLQIVESYRQDGQPRQRVIATLGGLDELSASGPIESLRTSGARFAGTALGLSAFDRGELTTVTKRRIGPSLIFERLGEETRLQGRHRGACQSSRLRVFAGACGFSHGAASLVLSRIGSSRG